MTLHIMLLTACPILPRRSLACGRPCCARWESSPTTERDVDSGSERRTGTMSHRHTGTQADRQQGRRGPRPTHTHTHTCARAPPGGHEGRVPPRRWRGGAVRQWQQPREEEGASRPRGCHVDLRLEWTRPRRPRPQATGLVVKLVTRQAERGYKHARVLHCFSASAFTVHCSVLKSLDNEHLACKLVQTGM